QRLPSCLGWYTPCWVGLCEAQTFNSSLRELIYRLLPFWEGRGDFQTTASQYMDALPQCYDVPVSDFQRSLDRRQMITLVAHKHERHCVCVLKPSIKELLPTSGIGLARFKLLFHRNNLSLFIGHVEQSSLACRASV
ncbi:hypothetical protein ALP04_00797, partial [Pseudomonas amygdali pv. sesami]